MPYPKYSVKGIFLPEELTYNAIDIYCFYLHQVLLKAPITLVGALTTKPAFTYSKSTMETPGQCVKSVQYLQERQKNDVNGEQISHTVEFRPLNLNKSMPAEKRFAKNLKLSMENSMDSLQTKSFKFCYF